jgi:hypothetical protein
MAGVRSEFASAGCHSSGSGVPRRKREVTFHRSSAWRVGSTANGLQQLIVDDATNHHRKPE